APWSIQLSARITRKLQRTVALNPVSAWASSTPSDESAACWPLSSIGSKAAWISKRLFHCAPSMGAHLWVQVALRAGHSEQSEAQLREGDRAWEGSVEQTVEKLRPYVLGWKAYFGLAQTPGIWRELDEWLRHRLRAIQLKQWKRPKTIYRELKALGASEDVANQVAGNCHRWWRNSDGVIKRVLTIAYFDRLGLPRLS